MLGRIVIREDIVFLYDEPVIDADIVRHRLNDLTKALRTTGNHRIIVTGGISRGDVDDATLEQLLGALTSILPSNARIAFVHENTPGVRQLSDQASTWLNETGIAALSAQHLAPALEWLGADTG